MLFRKADDFAFENSQSGGAGLLNSSLFSNKRLIADADAEERFAGFDEFARGFEQFLFAQCVDAIVECADAGQHHRPRIADFIRRLHDAHVRADLEQRLVDAAQVAGAVIEQSNHRVI